jgi:hypothetical protein
MARDRRRLTVASIVIIGAILLVVAVSATLSPSNHATTISSSTLTQSTSKTSTATTVTLGTFTSGSNVTVYNLQGPCNCSVMVPQATYPTLPNLIYNSAAVFLANVSSTQTVVVMGIPFTIYHIEVVQTLIPVPSAPGQKIQPGTMAVIAWIGGTANGTSMSAAGYPTLTVGSTYVFFMSAFPGYNMQQYWGHIDYGIAESTTGGAQGLFYVRDGKVYSLDNMYPQADSWLSVKVDGEPLSQFISDVQTGLGQ